MDAHIVGVGGYWKLSCSWKMEQETHEYERKVLEEQIEEYLSHARVKFSPLYLEMKSSHEKLLRLHRYDEAKEVGRRLRLVVCCCVTTPCFSCPAAPLLQHCNFVATCPLGAGEARRECVPKNFDERCGEAPTEAESQA